jgi:hypothetical protein
MIRILHITLQWSEYPGIQFFYQTIESSSYLQLFRVLYHITFSHIDEKLVIFILINAWTNRCKK